MRENRVRAAELRLAQLLIKLSLVAAGLAACAGGCAAQVDTLQPGDETVAGAGGTSPVPPAGGKSSSGGSDSPMAGASGGPVVNAFGGTSSSGGKGSSGAGSGGVVGSGGKAQGGSAGAAQAGAPSGGNKNGGAGGQAGGGGRPSGGAANGGTTGSGGASSLTCLASWKNDKCDTCSSQTQSDKLGCVQILDCYYQNSCGPATCSGNTEKCGANNVAKGTAGYPIASDVYMCLCK